MGVGGGRGVSLRATEGCASNLKLQFQSDAHSDVFQPGWANAGDTGSPRSDGDKYNLDIVVKSSQGSKHRVHTNHWHLMGKKTPIKN